MNNELDMSWKKGSVLDPIQLERNPKKRYLSESNEFHISTFTLIYLQLQIVFFFLVATILLNILRTILNKLGS